MVKKPQKTLVLLDVHAIIHRAYHAVPNLSSSAGIPTGALYGLLNMILKMIKDLDPDYVVACYDLPQKTFRHVAYEGYKKGRKETEDALKVQIGESRNIFEALNIPVYEVPGFEADDMLGTITEQVLKNFPDLKIVIVSGDMDTLQLVEGDRITVYTLKKGITDTIIYNEQTVIDRYGFSPEQVADYKGLRGDPSDNIIGIAGIGEKTATELITKFGSIENIYAELHKDPKILLDQKVKQRTVDLLTEHEEDALFSKTLATIRRDAPIEFIVPDHEFKSGYSPEKMVRLLREYEFRSLVTKFESLFGPAAPRPIDNADWEEHSQVRTDESLLAMRASVGLWVLNSDMVHPTSAEVLLETEADTLEEAFAAIRKKLAEKKLLDVFEKIEEPLIPIIFAMREHGILIDKNLLAELSQKYHSELDRLAEEIFAITKKPFNINSPKQLSDILFNELGLKPKGKKNKTGSFSTRSEVLMELIDTHPIIQKIIDHRELQKLVSTYIDVLPTLLDEHNRLHAEFQQHGTTTGRFSSQNPNLQNIPIRSDLGRAIRSAFIAAPGHTLVAADYSQIELRILAILSGDKILQDVFVQNRDIHTAVASRVFHVAESEVTHNQRRDAKVINFGILYGMGITALQRNLGTTRAEAETFYEAYFNEFPAIRNYLETVKQTARETLQTQTLFGRIRNFPMFKSKLPFMQALAERTAVNAPIQGSNADVVKLAMIDIHTVLVDKKWDTTIVPVLQIHDELVYEVPDHHTDDFKIILQETMESVLERHHDLIIHHLVKAMVPLQVTVKSGKTLGSLE